MNYRNLLERIRNFVLLDATDTDLKRAIVRAFAEAGMDLHNPLVARGEGSVETPRGLGKVGR